MAAATTPDRQKPVKLQINNSGSWKNVVRFDAAEPTGTSEVMDAAEALGRVDGNVTFRVVMDDPLSQVLYHWSKDLGWKVVEHG